MDFIRGCTMRLMKILHNWLMARSNKKHTHVTYYEDPETPIHEIRILLLQSAGGQVDLVMNEDTSIATLCLSHPEKRNAISGKMMVDMENALQTLQSWETGKGLIVYGSGQTFCSGGDLNMARMFSNPNDGFRMATYMQAVLHQLENLPLLTVALIEGTGAIGGGSEIAVACDFRLFTFNTAGIGFVHSHMGITPAWGGCTRLVNIIGYNKALDLMATGRRVASQEAMDMGLCDGVVNSMPEAQEWLSSRVTSDVQVIKALKVMSRNAKTLNCQDSLAQEKRIFAPLWGGLANLAALRKNIKHK